MIGTRANGYYRWTVLGIIMLGTFMAILDSSIVNVALPHMMSAFGVNRDKIEWVVTAFMLATAVAMTLSGWLAGRMGYKTLYLGSLFVFTVGSALCAVAWNYNTMIAARVIQAVGGGAIQPIGMAIMADLFKPYERGRALGIWGMGVMVGPTIGPTLGGYLTDEFSWRSIFSINIPFGIITILFGLLIMKSDSAPRQRNPFDFFGFFFLSIALISGLIALSNGQEKGWDSNYILTCSVIAVVGLTFFIVIEASVAHPLLDLKLFLVRNFTLSMLLAIFRSVGLFGGLFLLPLFLENLVGYTTIQAGLWMMPGAVTVGIMMPIAGKLTDRYSYRALVTVGSVLTGVSLIMYGYLDPLSSAAGIIGPQIIRGIGLALMMTPLLTAALNAVPPETMAMTSSFLNVAQRFGGAFGIAVLNTFVTNSTHVHAVRLGAMLPPQSRHFYRFALCSASLNFNQLHGLLPTEKLKATSVALQTILRHAQTLGYQNGFVFAGVFLLAGIPLGLLLESHSRNK